MIDKKVIVIGDLHIGNNKNNPIFHKISLDYARWLVELGQEHNITQIIQLGDVFHDRNNIHVSSMTCAYEFFDILKEFDIHIVTGNHDALYNNTSEVHSLKMLSQWENIHIHEKVDTIGDITFCGWGTQLNDIPLKQGIIFGHFDIKGFDMSAGKVSEHGFTAADLMDRCELLMTGHYHKPQVRMYNKSKRLLCYTGSCFQLNWGESGEEKMVYILDTERKSFSGIPNTISPKFEYIRSKQDYNKIANNFVSIESTVDTHDAIVAEMVAAKALDIRTINMVSKKIDISGTAIDEFKGVSFVDVVEEYLQLPSGLTSDELLLVKERSVELYNSCS